MFLSFTTFANNLTVFYTDFGVLPREVLPTKFGGIRHFTLNVLSSDYWFQFALVVLGICSSICMILGIYARYTVFASWILFLSFYNRNTLVVDGGDDAMRIFLFLFCFLPTAVYFSVDSKDQRSDEKPNPAASIALILQLASIYFFSAMLKTSPQWNTEGTALHYALALGVFTSKLGDQLLKFPELLKILTRITWYTEIIAPLLLVIPIFNNLFRTIVVITFIGFHLGLALFMDLGLFPYTMIAAWLALIPPWVWELKAGQSFSVKLNALIEKVSRKFSTKQPLEPSFYSSTFTTLFCIFFCVYITLWNIRGLDFGKFSPYFSPKLNFIGNGLRIDQYWALFAPRPTQEGGWDIALGKLRNKTSVNIKDGSMPDFKRPKTTASHYQDFRWKKYTLNTWAKTNAQYRKYYANYLCRKWNSTHTGQYAAEEVKLIFMLEKSLPSGMGVYRSFPQPHVTLQQKCPLD